jgi:signal transduction histidine kinase
MLAQHAELVALNVRVTEAQNQLLQSEKLASIGQLAAGVAHEINNPIGYVHSNIGSLDKYLNDLFTILAAYESNEAAMRDAPGFADLQRVKLDLEVDFLKEDIPMLMHESKEGISRVRKIVQDLKDFSRGDSNDQWQWANLHQGIDSTLNIVNNEIKYCAEVMRRYGDLPEVQCLPSQLNQVFMNLLVNAAHAIKQERGTITIATGHEGESVWVEVRDNGCGISQENLKRIFDPFFTTKPVGKGTGLGLSLSYGIVQKHGGRIDVESEPGVGTAFRVWLPVRQIPQSASAAGSALPAEMLAVAS